MTKYLLSMVLFFALLPAADAGAAKVRILVESPTGLQQKVYMTRPAGLTAERPIVLVMHGMRRNADEYRSLQSRQCGRRIRQTPAAGGLVIFCNRTDL